MISKDSSSISCKSLSEAPSNCFSLTRKEGEYVIYGSDSSNAQNMIVTIDSSTLTTKNVYYFGYYTSYTSYTKGNILNTQTGYLVTVNAKSSSDGSNYLLAYKLSNSGTVEYLKQIVKCTYAKAFTLENKIAVVYSPDDIITKIMITDQNFTPLSEQSLGNYKLSDVIKNTFKEELIILSFISNNRFSGTIFSVLLDPCADGYARAADYSCLPCDPSCKLCVEPFQSSSCTSCNTGLFPTSSGLKFSCNVYGTDLANVNCIKSYGNSIKDKIIINANSQQMSVYIYVNYNSLENLCTSMETKISLSLYGQKTYLSQKIEIFNSTTLAITMDPTLMDTYCLKMLDGANRLYSCELWLDLVTKPAGNLGASFRILVDITMTTNNITTSYVSFGMADIYTKQKNVNESSNIPVDSKLCSDELCTNYSQKTSYNQGDTVVILHYPRITNVKITSVAQMKVSFTNGTTKDANDYLVSELAGLSGQLTTKIRLLDSAPDYIVVTFYLNTQNYEARLLQSVDLDQTLNNGTNETGNYTISQYKFIVASQEIIGDSCKSKNNCFKLSYILIIAGCGLVLCIGIGIFIWCKCKKAAPEMPTEEPKKVGESADRIVNRV